MPTPPLPEEILNKLHTALYHISPLATDRELIISQMGETIWVESLEKIVSSVPEPVRAQVVALLNADKLDKAVELLETTDVDLDAVLTEVSTSVMKDVLETGNEDSVKS